MMEAKEVIEVLENERNELRVEVWQLKQELEKQKQETEKWKAIAFHSSKQ